MKCFFSEQKDVFDRQVLTQALQSVGLNIDKALKKLFVKSILNIYKKCDLVTLPYSINCIDLIFSTFFKGITQHCTSG